MKPPPKPELLALATFLRKEMIEREWRVVNLNEKLGWARTSTKIYTWLNGTNAPSEHDIEKLKAIFPNAPSEIFLFRESANIVQEDNTIPMVRTTRVNNPLQFSILSDGTARLQLDITGPIEELTILLRMLLDQNELLKR